MKIAYAALALLAAGSCAQFVREGVAFGEWPLGLVLWLIFVVTCFVIASLIAGVVWLARRTRPSRALLLSALLAVTIVLFPVQATWDTIEGEDSAGGLAAAVDAVMLRADVRHEPTLYYTESCCG